MSAVGLNYVNAKDKSAGIPRYIYALIALTALMIAATISYSTYLANRTTFYYAPLIEAAHELRVSSALAHLWAEEFLFEDPDVQADDVINHFNTAYSYTAVMLDGGLINKTAFAAVKDQKLRDILKLTQEKIANCENITAKRFALKDKAVVGTDMDQAFDIAFADLLKTSSNVDDRLNTVMKADIGIFHSVQSGLFLSCFFMAGMVGMLVSRSSRSTTDYLQTIEANNRQLYAMNQQLTAAEQQLKAANQQLLAGDQQLRAANQQLIASEQALRESECRFRSLFTDMAEGVALHQVIYDGQNRPVNYKILNVNPQYEKILNVTSGQVVGKLATEAYGVSEPPYITEYSNVAETGIPYSFETYFPPLKKYFSISVSSFEKGHFATIFTDSTEQRKAEEAVKLNAERLEILWETSQYRAVSVTDLLDYALERSIKLTGSRIGYLYHYDENEKIFNLNSWSKEVMNECNIMKKETSYSLDCTGIWGEAVRQARPIILNDYQAHHSMKKGCPEGHAMLSRFMTIPVFSDSKIIAVVGVANKTDEYDESDVKQLTLFMHSVWKLVEKLHSDEEHLKLKTRTQKLESLGILAGGIAHDFNNLLTAILSNINLASMKSKGDEKISKRLAEAEKACLRSQDLTKQLLTFAGGGSPVKRAVRPDEIIRDSAVFALRGSNIEGEFNFAEDLSPIEADEGQIGQVISNLTINAMQAMPEGGNIKFSADNIELGNEHNLPLKIGPYVKITVEDSGVGIPEQHFHKIFDPYFTTKQKGSGLGLAITYSIINKHNGHITVKSGLGKGAIFDVYIPVCPGKDNSMKPSDNEIMPGCGTILLMDDDRMVAEAGGEILRECGYDVVFARDGREAIKIYAEMKNSVKPVDLVIMDLTIPGGMGGKEAIKELIRIDPYAKVIVSSGYSNDPVMADFRSYGFKGVLAKPFKVNDLINTIQQVMNAMP